MERVAIIDYGSGNLRSVQKAFERAAREFGISAHIDVTADPETVASADRIVLPGVGAFSACMDGLSSLPGMLEKLEHVVLIEKRPFLGICVGMQLLAEFGEEFGRSRGLGWIAGAVRPIDRLAHDLRSPHMGWNTVTFAAHHPVLDAIDDESDFYFAHSFHFDVENEEEIIGVCHYGQLITAAVARDNIVGVQFHPEKSQHAGVALLRGFLQWRPL